MVELNIIFPAFLLKCCPERTISRDAARHGKLLAAIFLCSHDSTGNKCLHNRILK